MNKCSQAISHLRSRATSRLVHVLSRMHVYILLRVRMGLKSSCFGRGRDWSCMVLEDGWLGVMNGSTNDVTVQLHLI